MSPSELRAACLAAESGGATSVQLRLKDTSTSTQLAAVTDLVGLLTLPLYVNDRADVARVGGAAGVHCGADDLPPGLIRRVMPRPLRVGVSVGSPEEAARARDADADYWSIGPWARTGSKADAGRSSGTPDVR